MNVVINLLGSTLDNFGQAERRWEKWRPSVALAMQPDFKIDRYHLLYPCRFKRLAVQVAADIRTVSPSTEVVITELTPSDPWDFEEVYGKLYDYARSCRFREEDEYYIHITTGTHVAQICLFLLTESRHLPGKLVQTGPTKHGPQGQFSIIDLDLSRYDLLARRFGEERDTGLCFLKSGIDTRNERFNALIETIEQMAVRSGDPILLAGPTGAGKSRLARKLYELRRRNRRVTGKFVEVNCATLRGDSAMSALFGHVRGAFTGAAQDRAGLLREADQGILFLDEIGELGLDEQAMLLRAVEEGVFMPLGSDTLAESRFQLICGSNRDLKMEVAKGNFREDLLARIDLWTFRLPGLAERREDIEPNLDYELEEYRRKNGAVVTINSEARRRFLDFALSAEAKWSANFRDLNAAVVRMATLAPGGRIDRASAESEIARLTAAWSRPEQEDTLVPLLGADYRANYDQFDLIQLREVVKICRETRSLSEAGRRLFAVTRARKAAANDADRLRKYLAKFHLTFDQL